MKEFLRANLATHAGDIIDIDTNKVVGSHDGFEFYTIGQREGLGIGGAREPYYVVAKDKEQNIVYVAQGSQNKHLYSTVVHFSELHMIASNFSDVHVQASIRYRQTPVDGIIDIENNLIRFEQPVRAAAAGQSIVFYEDTKCIASAIIEETPQ